MHNLKLIVVREYLARVKNKTFMIMTFLSPLIFVGIIALISYLTMLTENQVHTVAIHNKSGLFKEQLQKIDDTKFVDYSNLSLEAAQDSVAANEYSGLLFIPSSFKEKAGEERIVFYTGKSPDDSFLSSVESLISKKMTHDRLVANGVNLVKLSESQTKISIQIENFAGQRTSKVAKYIKMFFGGAAGYLLMMFIIIYGNMVLRSVIEEKTNRIVEIIVSSVKPIHLMLGKIIGTTLAGISQFMIWVILGGILMVLVPMVFGIDINQLQPSGAVAGSPTVPDEELRLVILTIFRLPLLKLVIFFLIYFIGGYFLYSSIYAAIGGAVDSETDSQQFMLPIVLPLILAIYVGFFAVIENPHGTVPVIFSMVPLTSPIVMLMRIPFGVPWWEIAISILILVGSIAGTVWIAAKIYRIGILMYGKKPSYKELYKWMKY